MSDFRFSPCICLSGVMSLSWMFPVNLSCLFKSNTLWICRTYVLGSFFTTYSYICSNLRFLVVEQISLVCFTWVFCLWVPLFTLTGQKCQFPQYLMDMQNTPSAMSGHVQVLLCKKLKLECEDKWCSDSENFINPSRGNFLLDHSTIQWHEGIR